MKRYQFIKSGGRKIIHIFKSEILFLWVCTYRPKIISCGIYSTSRGFSSNWFVVEITPIQYILTSSFGIVKVALFIYIHFWQHSGQYFWSKFISLCYRLFSCNASLQWIWLNYLVIFSMGISFFFFARGGVQYPRIFPFH